MSTLPARKRPADETRRGQRRRSSRSSLSPKLALLPRHELAWLLDDEDAEFATFLMSLYAMIGFDPEVDPYTDIRHAP